MVNGELPPEERGWWEPRGPCPSCGQRSPRRSTYAYLLVYTLVRVVLYDILTVAYVLTDSYFGGDSAGLRFGAAAASWGGAPIWLRTIIVLSKVWKSIPSLRLKRKRKPELFGVWTSTSSAEMELICHHYFESAIDNDSRLWNFVLTVKRKPNKTETGQWRGEALPEERLSSNTKYCKDEQVGE